MFTASQLYPAVDTAVVFFIFSTDLHGVSREFSVEIHENAKHSNLAIRRAHQPSTSVKHSDLASPPGKTNLAVLHGFGVMVRVRIGKICGLIRPWFRGDPWNYMEIRCSSPWRSI